MNTTRSLITLRISGLVNAVRAAMRREALRHRYHLEYRDLNHHGDHILKDIGVSRDQLRSAERDLRAGHLPDDRRTRGHL